MIVSETNSYRVVGSTPQVEVVTTLYGAVTPERIAKETAAAQYRAEQLSPLPPRRQREFLPRFDRLDRALRDADDFTQTMPRRLRGKDRDRRRSLKIG